MTDATAVQAAIRSGATKLVWVETPANPLRTIIDTAAIVAIAHAAGALLAVDSTSATPVLSHPLDLGAELVMHSGTKCPGLVFSRKVRAIQLTLQHAAIGADSAPRAPTVQRS